MVEPLRGDTSISRSHTWLYLHIQSSVDVVGIFTLNPFKHFLIFLCGWGSEFLLVKGLQVVKLSRWYEKWDGKPIYGSGRRVSKHQESREKKKWLKGKEDAIGDKGRYRAPPDDLKGIKILGWYISR